MGEQYGKKGQASDSIAPLPSPVPCLLGETLATPGTRCWPALHFPCWKLRLTYMWVNMPGSDLLWVHLEHLDPIGAELKGEGTAASEDYLE